jgi:hypothetical protein
VVEQFAVRARTDLKQYCHSTRQEAYYSALCPGANLAEMVKFSIPSSTSSKAREHWRYDRINQLDGEDGTGEASASAIESSQSQIDQMSPDGAGLRKSEDVITYVPTALYVKNRC